MMYTPLTLDFADKPQLKIKVDTVGDKWGLKVKDASNQVVTLQADTNATGEQIYELSELTHWIGTKTVNLEIWVVGEGSSMKVDWIKLVKPPAPPETILWQHAFETTDGWVSDQALIVSDGQKATITENQQDYSYDRVYTTLDINFDAKPMLNIKVDEVGAQWGLKLNDVANVTALLQAETNATGEMSYDLQQLSGWTGSKTVNLEIWVVGEGSSIKVDWIKIVKGPDTELPSELELTTMIDFPDTNGWTLGEGATMTTDGAAATIGGTAARTIAVDLDNNPYLKVKVKAVQGQWALKLNTGNAEIPLQPNSSDAGMFDYDLGALTGLSGRQTFTLELQTFGASSELTVNWLRFDPHGSSFNWSLKGVEARMDGSKLQLTPQTGYSGTAYASYQVTADLDATPYLGVQIEKSGLAWRLVVNDGSGDVIIQPSTQAVGQFNYRLPQLTGWSGVKTFELKVIVVGAETTLTMDWIRLGHAAFAVSQGADLGIGPSGAVITQTDRNYYWGSVNFNAVVDLDLYPYIEIDIAKTETHALWGLKLNDGVDEKVVQLDNVKLGKLAYNVKELTGWSGKKQVAIKIFSIGSGKKLHVRSMRFLNIQQVPSGDETGEPEEPENPGSGPGSGPINNGLPNANTGTYYRLTAADLNDSGSASAPVVVTLKDGAEGLVIPATLLVDWGNRSLEVRSGNQASLQLTGAALRELQSGLKDRVTESIILKFGETSADAEGRKISDSAMRPSGAAFTIGLFAVLQDGQEIDLNQQSLPMTLRLLVDGPGANLRLAGIYRYDEERQTWSYIGGQLNTQKLEMTAELAQPGTYAVMTYTKRYRDMKETHWAFDAVLLLSARHVIQGTGNDEFSPDGITTRAEFATMLARALGIKASASASFRDVAPGAWYADAVAAMYEAKVVTGRNAERFDPHARISREEMAVILARAYAYAAGRELADTKSSASFRDESMIAAWARSGVAFALNTGLMQGQSNRKFAPQSTATRAETAQGVVNLLDALNRQ